MKIKIAQDAGEEFDGIDELRTFLEDRRDWSDLLFEDGQGDLFTPLGWDNDTLDALVLTDDAVFTYRYSATDASMKHIARVVAPTTVTLTFNQ